MKPIKILYPFSIWLLRISMLVFAYFIFFDEVKALNLDTVNFYKAILFCLSAIALFVGGFLGKPTATVLAAIFIFLISAFQIVKDWTGVDAKILVFLFPLVLAFFFFSVPVNKRK
jgi:hypothetical protein